MKPIHSLLLLLPLAVYISSCNTDSKASETRPSDVIPVKVIALNNSTQAGVINASGQFTTDDEAMLSFKTGGVIERIFVKEGDAVRKGQVLATLNLTEINAQVQQAGLAYEKAKRDYQRTVNLHNDSVATLEQLQNAKTGLDLAAQQLKTVSFNRSYSEIRAPKDGYILRKLANEGQVITSGTAVLQSNGAQSGNWMLRVGVSDKQWAAIQLNDEATVETAAADGQGFTGKISRKSEGTDAASGSFTVDIKLTGTKPDAIAAGMFGKAVIHATGSTKTAQHNNWSVPYDALLDGDGSTGYVFVTSDNKTAKKIKVSVASVEKDHVLVNSGLENAGALIVSGSAYLTDNSPIRVIQ
jgi:RND family efflux transporter MFP subunit